MINAFYALKVNQSQGFTTEGNRMPITRLQTFPVVILAVKTKQKDGYNALKVGFGSKRATLITKAEMGVLKKAGLDQQPPRFLKEIKLDEQEIQNETMKSGMKITAADVLKEGDVISVTGVSKGKGFQGVVRRHHFKGGPATHGQSDRERAPGAIGSGTTPGRIYKGKRMAGRMGRETVTIKNLKIISVDGEKNIITIKGLVPGGRNAVIMIQKIGPKHASV